MAHVLLNKVHANAHPARTPRAEKPTGSQRMRSLIVALALGRTIKEIAFDWDRSPNTVEWFWLRAKATFGLRCYQDAVWFALRRGWIQL